MRRSRGLVAGGLLVAAAVVAILWAQRPETTAAPPAGSAGQVIHLDPETGQPTVPGPDAALPGDGLSTSTEGLEVVPSELPGGGVKMDLQGRFQSTVVGAVGDSDSVHAECLGGR